MNHLLQMVENNKTMKDKKKATFTSTCFGKALSSMLFATLYDTSIQCGIYYHLHNTFHCLYLLKDLESVSCSVSHKHLSLSPPPLSLFTQLFWHFLPLTCKYIIPSLWSSPSAFLLLKPVLLYIYCYSKLWSTPIRFPFLSCTYPLLHFATSKTAHQPFLNE